MDLFLLVVGFAVMLGLAGYLLYRVDIGLAGVQRLLARSRYLEAVDRLKRLSQRRKKAHPLAWFLARAYAGLEDFPSALVQLKRIPQTEVRTNRYYSTLDYYLLLTDMYARTGQHDEAVKFLVYLKSTGYDNWIVNYLIARNCHETNDDRKAVHFLEIALKKNPKSSEALCLMGVIQYGLKNWVAGLEYLKKAHFLDPLDQEAKITLGFTYFRREMYSLAIDALRDSIPGEDLREEFMYILGSSYFKVRDYSNAYVKLYTLVSRSSATAKNYKDILYKLAFSAEQTGKFFEARDFWERLNSLDDKYQDTSLRHKLAKLYSAREAFKVYLFSSLHHFKVLVRSMLEARDYRVNAVDDIGGGIVEASASRRIDTDNREKMLFRFIRSAEVIDKEVLSLFYQKMKDAQCRTGSIFTIGGQNPEVEQLTHVYSIEVKNEDTVAEMADQGFEIYRRQMGAAAG